MINTKVIILVVKPTFHMKANYDNSEILQVLLAVGSNQNSFKTTSDIAILMYGTLVYDDVEAIMKLLVRRSQIEKHKDGERFRLNTLGEMALKEMKSQRDLDLEKYRSMNRPTQILTIEQIISFCSSIGRDIRKHIIPTILSIIAGVAIGYILYKMGWI